MARVKARCKFRVGQIVQHLSIRVDADGNPLSEETISLLSEYDNDGADDARFVGFNPQGEMTFRLTNPNLVGTFSPGDLFYVDLIPIPVEEGE